MKATCVGLMFLVTLCAPAISLSRTWHVPSECPTIQAGIDSATAGDTVVVACGTYYEHGIAMKSGICLRSEAGGSDCVTVDANGGQVLSCVDVDSTASIEGFSLTGGHDVLGGGMWCYRSDVKIRDCVLAENSADHGGGVYCLESSPQLTRCKFVHNVAGFGGGGAYFDDSRPTLERCEFTDNVNGGMLCLFSSVTLTECVFADNDSRNGPGAIGCAGSSLALRNCTLFENWTFYWTESSAVIDCGSDNTLVLENSIIAFSSTARAIYCEDASTSVVLSCCDIYGNEGGDWTGCIADQYGVDGNICLDPLFCDPDNDDFQIDAASPCAPGNHPNYACGLIGAFDVGCDTSSAERETWGRLKAKYREHEVE